MTKENEQDDWEVPCSDEETESDEIPLPVVLLYKQIQEKQVLELRVREYRRPKPGTPQQRCDDHTAAREASDNGGDERPAEDKAAEPVTKPNAAPSVFDYDDVDEGDNGTGTCQLPKRTPKSGRLNRKRCATLQNVISDLKRFHDLDTRNNETKQALVEKQPEKNASLTHGTESRNPAGVSSALQKPDE